MVGPRPSIRSWERPSCPRLLDGTCSTIVRAVWFKLSGICNSSRVLRSLVIGADSRDTQSLSVIPRRPLTNGTFCSGRQIQAHLQVCSGWGKAGLGLVPQIGDIWVSGCQERPLLPGTSCRRANCECGFSSVLVLWGTGRGGAARWGANPTGCDPILVLDPVQKRQSSYHQLLGYTRNPPTFRPTLPQALVPTPTPPSQQSRELGSLAWEDLAVLEGDLWEPWLLDDGPHQQPFPKDGDFRHLCSQPLYQIMVWELGLPLALHPRRISG